MISPHLDDGVFSAYAALADPGATLVTVFTEPAVAGSTHWSTACGFPDAATEFAQRRIEDQAACAHLGVECIHLGANANNLPGMREVLEQYLTSVLQSGRTVLLPAGAGGSKSPGTLRQLLARLMRRPAGCAAHSEHEVVRDAALEQLRSSRIRDWGFYVENPYVWNDSLPRLRRVLQEMTGMPLREMIMSPDTDMKLDAADRYHSQAVPILGTKASWRRKTLAHPEVYFLAT